jgi:hypothetical protein
MHIHLSRFVVFNGGGTMPVSTGLVAAAGVAAVPALSFLVEAFRGSDGSRSME